MYLMYVDESGDSGLRNSPTRYFALSGIVLHELRWHQYLDALVTFRRKLKGQFGLRLRDEFHAADLISKPGEFGSIKLHKRIEMIRLYADFLAGLTDINVINVVVDKQGKGSSYDVFETAWKTLIQRFTNTLSNRNFRGPQNSDDRGVLICDNTDNKKLTELKRKMRHFNPIPNSAEWGGGFRQLPVTILAEDPVFKHSHHSYFVQSADLSAFLLYQKFAPNKQMRKKAGQNFFKRLEPVLCTRASRTDPLGIVKL